MYMTYLFKKTYLWSKLHVGLIDHEAAKAALELVVYLQPLLLKKIRFQSFYHLLQNHLTPDILETIDKVGRYLLVPYSIVGTGTVGNNSYGICLYVRYQVL